MDSFRESATTPLSLSIDDVVVIVRDAVAPLVKPFVDFVWGSPRADGRTHSAHLSGREEVPILLKPFEDVLPRFVTLKNGLDRSANLKLRNALFRYKPIDLVPMKFGVYHARIGLLL